MGITAEGEIVSSNGTIGGGICNNGILNSGEQCDGGNVVSGGFCSSECMCEVQTATIFSTPSGWKEFQVVPGILVPAVDTDSFANQSPLPGNDTVSVTVSSAFGDEEVYDLPESQTSAGIFRNTIFLEASFTAAIGDGTLQYRDVQGEQIRPEYIEPADCQRNVDAPRIRFIVLDEEAG